MTIHSEKRTSLDAYRRRFRLVMITIEDASDQSMLLVIDQLQIVYRWASVRTLQHVQSLAQIKLVLDQSAFQIIISYINPYYRLVLYESFQNKRLDYTHTMTPVYLFVMVYRQDARQVSHTVGLCVQIHISSSFFLFADQSGRRYRQTGLDMTRFEDILDQS